MTESVKLLARLTNKKIMCVCVKKVVPHTNKSSVKDMGKILEKMAKKN